MKKYWETGEKNDFGKECYKLHFSQFYEEDDEKDKNSRARMRYLDRK